MASLTPIKVGDIVQVDHKGRRFHAIVLSKRPRLLSIKPLESGITYTTATGREVVAHWRRTKNTPRAASEVDNMRDGVAH